MTNSSANDRQVGGSHYAGAYQHWDFADDAKLGGHEWQVTRYISRHRKKNGLQDLGKAAHHVQKMMERNQSHGRQPQYGTASVRALNRFLIENHVEDDDARALVTVCTWRTLTDLTILARQIERLEAAYTVHFPGQQPAVLTHEQKDAVDETAGLRACTDGEGNAPD